MYCEKCGNELPDGASFCASCGTQQTEKPVTNFYVADTQDNSKIRPPEIYTQSQPENIPGQPVKKLKKRGTFLRVLFILILALVLVSGVTVLGYFTVLPAKQTLMIAEYASVIKGYNAFDKNMTIYEDKSIKPLYESSIEKESEFSFSLDPAILEQSGLPSDTVDLIAESLKSISLKYGYAVDSKNKKETAHLGINYLRNPVLSANFFLDGTKFGFGVPELSPKTIVGDLKNIDQLAEVFPDIPQETLSPYKSMDPWISARIYNEIKIDRKDIKTLLIDYSKEIIDSIDSDDMTIKRGQSTKVLGKDMTCQEVTIKLDQKAQKKIISNILTKLKDDKNFYNLTAGNIIKMFDILGENELYEQMLQGIDIKDELSKTNFKKQILEMKDNLDESDFPEKITAKVYIKGLDVVKYAITFVSDTSDEDILFTIEDRTNDLSFERKYTISGGMEGEAADLSLSLKKDYDKSSETTDFTASLDVDIDMADEIGNVNFTLKSKEDPSGKTKVKHTIDATMKLDIVAYGVQQQGEVALTLEGTKTRNSKGLVSNSDYTGDLVLDAPDQLPEPVSIGFAITTDTEYGNKVILPATPDVLDIATATKEDYDNLMNEIYEKVGSLFTLFGSL